MHENLASYASNPTTSKGRLFREATSFRNEFQRDINRIINSTPFRRLLYKTQVFVNDTGDHYRTRLTHSLEVAQIGKVIASALDLSTELTECLCLAHDIGHPPFGHAGENALALCMIDHGGFDHNEYALKLLTELEVSYLDFSGLNLCWETLDGLIKHNGPIIDNPRPYTKFYAQKHNIKLNHYASLEAQVASLADDIAYNSHDLEDGLRAGLFTVEDICQAGIFSEVISEVTKLRGRYEERKIVHEIIRSIMNHLTFDVIEQTRKNLKKHDIKELEQVYLAERSLVSFSAKAHQELNHLREFLYKNMYRHYQVNRMTLRATKIVKDLYSVYVSNPHCLPPEWQAKLSIAELPGVVCDYIAGMTDRFAADEHKKLCGF